MAITVHADFDAGAIKKWDVHGTHIILHLAPFLFNGRLRGVWFFVRIEGAKDSTLTVSFATDECELHGYKAENKVSMSRDGVQWEIVSESSCSGNDYHCSFHATTDRMWLARTAPYPVSRLTSKVQEWLKGPWIQPSRSSDSMGRIMRSSGGPWLTSGAYTGVAGQVIPPCPLYALELAAPGLPDDSPVVVLFGGNHAGEHMASYVLEALVEWWNSDEPEAVALRQKCRCLIYPMVNPAGRFGGFVRGGPEFPMGDHNRIWSPEDRGQLEHVDRIKEALAFDVKGDVEIFLDAHNTERVFDTFMYVNTSMMFREDGQALLPLLNHMMKDVPHFRMEPTDSLLVEPQNTTCKSWAAVAEDGPQATYSYTLEPGSPTNDQLGQCRHYGESLGRGLFDHFAG